MAIHNLRNAAIFGARHHLALAVAFAFFLVASPLCSASQDPALCPFELGYSPTFSSDGTQLFCNKGEGFSLGQVFECLFA